MLETILIVGFLIIAGVYIMNAYNRLVGLQVLAENAWSDIDVQLKRRHDLIPNLVETVKGYTDHEQETLERVIGARARAMTAAGPAERAEAEAGLTGALKSLFALSEDYPQLRAVESFTDLQESLENVEEALQNARRYYNAVVRDLNTAVVQVPSNIVANMFRIKPREFFETQEGEEQTPEVRF